MPNDCWNHITIAANENDITSFINEELRSVPEWALKMKVRATKGLIFNLWSRWQPDFKWMESMLKKYPSFWMKNEWSEEGGMAGVWIGTVTRNGDLETKQLAWDDLCIEERMAYFGDKTV